MVSHYLRLPILIPTAIPRVGPLLLCDFFFLSGALEALQVILVGHQGLFLFTSTLLLPILCVHLYYSQYYCLGKTASSHGSLLNPSTPLDLIPFNSHNN